MKPMSRLSKALLSAALVAGVLLLYARSISYPFVYDDVWRIVTNPGIRTTQNPWRFFTDTTTQSSLPDLQKDSYRPITILSFAVDYSFFKLNTAGYRLENLLLHGLNGALVFHLATELLALSVPGAAFAALLFLVHPVQTEAVVWIVERSNVLGLFFSLLSLACWTLYRKKKIPAAALGAHLGLILSLLTREVAVVVPVLFLLIDHLKGFKKRWGHYALAAGEVCAYLLVRSLSIGQMKIAPYKGGTLLSNLANVARIWPLYWRVVVAPVHLRITYADIEPVTGFLSGGALVGVAALALFAAAFAWSFKKASQWAIALSTIFLFWLPGSNLIPLMTLFGERLLYPPMVGFAWLGGLCYDRLKSKNLRLALALTSTLVLSAMTLSHLPVWSSELALWGNAVQQAPKAWFAWACFGQELQSAASRAQNGDPARSRALLEGSEHALDQALRNGPTEDSAARLLVLLAEVKSRLGKKDEASALAQRGIKINPSLAPAWQAFSARKR